MPSEETIIRPLDEGELVWLETSRSYAVALGNRYLRSSASEFSAAELDTIYSGWCRDSATDLPNLQIVYQGLAAAFGDAFARRLDLTWVSMTDSFGKEVSLHRVNANLDGGYTILSPFSMVGKRVRSGQPFFEELFDALVENEEARMKA